MEDKIKGIALLLFGILLSCAQDGLNDTIFASMSEIPFAICRTVRWHRWALPCVWQTKCNKLPFCPRPACCLQFGLFVL